MRCNIFKPLSSTTGEFLTFAQYVNDLTKGIAEGNNYRVVPSKFAVLNLDIDSFLEKFSESGITVGDNAMLPQILQSHFENSFAVLSDYDPDKIIDPERSVSSELLWRTLKEWDLIHVNDSHEIVDFNYFEELMYIDDINIHSNHQFGGFDYNEVICHIPTTEDCKYYEIVKGINDYSSEAEDLEVFPDEPIQDEPIRGWTSETYPQGTGMVVDSITDASNVGYYAIDDYRPSELDPKITNPLEAYAVNRHSTQDENISYNFNCIIVFYDIYYNQPDDSFKVLYRNRPMGIYLTGMVDDEREIATLKNSVVKYISNNDAYGQGSSYNLRILSRFVPTPNASTYEIEVASEVDCEEYGTLASAMGKLSDVLAQVDVHMSNYNRIAQSFKNHFALFRNNRTNVPYPRLVDGKYYWFVNGRNTGMICESSSAGGGGTYTYTQTSQSSTWNIQHNLGRYPSVTVVNLNGEVISCEVFYIDYNSIELRFSGAVSGNAYLN